MSYAEYARRGFFELVAVAALSLPLLLLADWSLDQRDPARVRRVPLARGADAAAARRDARLGALPHAALHGEYGLTELASTPRRSWGGWCWSSAGSWRRCCGGGGSGSARARCWRGGWCWPGSTWPIRTRSSRASIFDRAARGRPLERPTPPGSAPTPSRSSTGCSRRSAHPMRARRPRRSTPAGSARLGLPARWTIALPGAAGADRLRVVPVGS